MNIHSIEIPRITVKDCIFFVYYAATYIALGIWGSIAPQSIAQLDFSGRTESTTLVSYANELDGKVDTLFIGCHTPMGLTTER